MKQLILSLISSLLLLQLFAQSSVAKLPGSPKQMVVDSKDNVILHLYKGIIMKITPDGKTSFITEDIQKDFNKSPRPTCDAMTIDAKDNIYMATEDIIWKLTPDGTVTQFAGMPYVNTVKDGELKTAQFRDIEYMETDPAGNIYIVEKDDTQTIDPGLVYIIRKINNKGKVTTLTNTGNNPTLKTKWIAGMGVDSVGNLYLSDGDGRCIKKLATDGTITTLAGLCNKREFHPVYVQGDISKAELMAPKDILINKKGDVVFLDGRLNRIIKIANNNVTTIAGNSVIQSNNVNMGGRSKEGYKDGKALTALFNFPGYSSAMAIDSKQNIYIIDEGNNCIRKLSPDGMVSTFAKQ